MPITSRFNTAVQRSAMIRDTPPSLDRIPITAKLQFVEKLRLGSETLINLTIVNDTKLRTVFPEDLEIALGQSGVLFFFRPVSANSVF